MNQEQPLSARVGQFTSRASEMKPLEAEDALMPVLKDLLAGDGVALIELLRPTVQGVDYIARLPNGGGTIGVEYKHQTAERLGVDAIKRFVLEIEKRPLQRALLISRTGFTKPALEFAHAEFTTKLELLDLESLKGWAMRIERASSGKHSKVLAAIRQLSRDLARYVATNPSELDNMEWRDLERMMTVVLQRLGFDAELTPGSKDGGKDIVLKLADGNVLKTYAIELKHWRSGHAVGSGALRTFAEVVAREQHSAGLFIATSGFTADAFAARTEAQREVVKIGSDTKVVALCRTFVKAESGMWSHAPEKLEELLFEGTK